MNALPAGTLGPFGKWAAQIGNGHFCLAWPPPSGSVPLGPGPLPNVPVLAVNGGFDMRTPAASAAAVVSKFPQGQLIVVPASGTASSAPTRPSARLAPCGMDARGIVLDPVRPAEAARRTDPGLPAGAPKAPAAAPRATLALASKTLRDAQAVWLMTQAGAGDQVAGLYSGRLVGTGERLQARALQHRARASS